MVARRLGIAALALIVATACGTGAAIPTPTPPPTSTGTASPTPAASPSQAVDHAVVYFARDRLPPVAAGVPGAGVGTTVERRIRSRLDTLFTATAPVGLFNVARTVKARPAKVTVLGPLATIDFDVPNEDWGTAGSAGTRAFVQQVVYTASEEPGIRQVLLTQNGGKQAIIGGEGLVVDHPATREAVAGYTVPASLDRVRSFEGEEPSESSAPRPPVATISSRYSVDTFAPGLARFVVELERPGFDAQWLPTFDVSVAPDDTHAKWQLRVLVFDGTDSASDSIVARTPLRRLSVEPGDRMTVYRLALDDLRPWRVAVVFDPVRLIVDIGGDPDAVNANVAVYRPLFNQAVTPHLVVSGMTRAFEATFEYRLTNTLGAVLASGYGTASYGTSPIWGAFDVSIANVSAEARNLEVFLRSPRDGEITDLVSVPIARTP